MGHYCACETYHRAVADFREQLNKRPQGAKLQHDILAHAGNLRTALQLMKDPRANPEYVEWLIERTALTIVADAHRIHDPNGRLDGDLTRLQEHRQLKPPMRTDPSSELDVEPCSCTTACQGQDSLDAEGSGNRRCRLR